MDNFRFPGALRGNNDFAGLLASLASNMQSHVQVQPQPGATTSLQSQWAFPQPQAPAGVPVQWNNQYWQQQPHFNGAGPGLHQAVPQWPPQLPTMAQPSTPDLHGMLVSMLQTCLQQQQQQQQQGGGQQPPPPQQQAIPPAPVGSVLNDEALLVEALKSCKTDRVTPRQAIERLDGVNNHSASAWKDYFLDNLERLHSLSRPRHVLPPAGNASSFNGVASSQDVHSTTGLGERTSSAGHRPNLPLPRRREHPSDDKSQHPQVDSHASEQSSLPRSQGPAHPSVTGLRDIYTSHVSAESSVNAAGTRRTRGEPAAEFHAGTRIPPSSGRQKPQPPLSLIDVSRGVRKFTEAEHIFFIHYLRWRLMKDPMVAKQDLYTELAKEIPHHDAAAWKRHWDSYPQVPDQIYNSSAQRVPPSEIARQPASTARVARPSSFGRSAQHGTSSTDGSEDDSGDEPVSEDDVQRLSEPFLPMTRRRREATRGTNVTEEDVKAMARYMLENSATWESRRKGLERWKDFAAKPENMKRSLPAWVHIEVRRAQEIQHYYKKFAAEQRTASTQAKVPEQPSSSKDASQAGTLQSAVATDLQVKASKTPESSKAGQSEVLMEKGGLEVHNRSVGPEIQIPRKRGADELTLKAESPVHKRSKDEVIVVSD
ncbi:hypothetical protein BV20DRAFT_1117115 [Pilatotrama ljubarskyi]|nr:hypothetical protein BV20DRAFT_1117115 [Pilatotrama ljubarskyi]